MPRATKTPPERVGVIARPDIIQRLDPEVWRDPFYLLRDPEEPVKEALGELLDAGVSTTLVLGPDALVSEVFTQHRRHFSGHPTPLKLSVLKSGLFHSVAEALGAGRAGEKELRRFKYAAERGRLKRAQLGTLKVSSSALGGARYGFSCGMGVFYDLVETAYRAGGRVGGAGRLAQTRRLGRTALAALNRGVKQFAFEGGQAAEPLRARVSVDGHPRAERFGYLLMSSMRVSWLGVRFAPGGGYLLGDSARRLAALVAKNRALPAFLQDESEDLAPFETIHVDSSAGFVLDGELFKPAGPHILQVKPGPPVFFSHS